MSPKRVRRWVAWTIVAGIAATLLPPFINANRFRNKLAETIRASIGRPLSMGDVHFTLVPRPGFVISSLAITDDPAFSAEPVLRAESVTALLRLTSLWRGRLEIAQLSFENPSLNLVRSAEGRWNVESILRQASQVPAAPTGAPRPESRPRFPYIEATNGRINLREGQEKRPHVLMEADFALWLEAEGQWNTRLEARPTRTDAHLSDTGILRVSGWLRRAETLAATPLQLDIELEKAQLGQWSSLITGRDRGWRGNTDLQARVKGTIREIDFTASADITNFHRHDVANPDSLDVRIECTGRAASGQGPALPAASLDCALPLTTGTATVTGDVSLRREPEFDLKLKFRDVPMLSVVNAYRHIKRDVPEDLQAQGKWNGDYRIAGAMHPKDGPRLAGSGTGRVTGLVLESESRGASLGFGNFDVEFVSPKKGPASTSELVIGAAGVRMGGTVPVYVAARVTPTEVVAEAKGDADVNQLMNAAGMFGLTDPRYKATGFANFSLGVTGTFANFSAPLVNGSAQLRQIATQVDGVAAPLLVQSASVRLDPDKVAVDRISARLEGTDTVVEGSLIIPRHCASEECQSSFNLRTAELSLDDLNRALNPRYRSTDWLSLPKQIFRGQEAKASRLMTLRAEGKIAIARLLVKNLMATRVTAQVAFNQGRLELNALQGDILTGRHKGTWRVDLTTNEPTFRGKGTIENLPMVQINALLREPLATGTSRLTYDLTLRGSDVATLRGSAAGTGSFRWVNGSWRTSGPVPAVQFSDWSGELSIRDEVVDVTASTMQTRNGSYQVSGKTGFDRELSLRLSGRRDQMLVSGTWQQAAVAVQPAEAVSTRDSASNLKNASPTKARN